MLRQPLQKLDILGAGEVPALPLRALLPLLAAQVTLLVLNEALVVRGRIHIAAVDGLRDVQPRAAALDVVLVVDVGDDEVGGSVALRVPRVDLRAALLALVHDEGLGPLAVDAVQRARLRVGGAVQHRREAVLLAGQPAAAGVVDFGGEAARRLDEGVVVELDERRPAVQPLDVQRRQRDQVVFVVALQPQHRVPHLLHHDRQRPRHRRLLPVVPLQVHPVLLVPDAICRHRRVVRHLLADELRRARVVLPFGKKKLAQEGIERLLLTT